MTNTKTERRLAITPGDWTADNYSVLDSEGHEVVSTDNRELTILIADAGTTYNACHLTPSEMLEKLREVAGRLEMLTARAEEIEPQITRGGLEEEDAFIVARQQSRRFLSTINLPTP